MAPYESSFQYTEKFVESIITKGDYCLSIHLRCCRRIHLHCMHICHEGNSAADSVACSGAAANKATPCKCLNSRGKDVCPFYQKYAYIEQIQWKRNH